MTPRPSRVRLRAYKVGFGDCLLFTVIYGSALPDGRRERHMLIDCGTVKGPDKGPTLAQVAGQVAEHCNGQLDAVVASNRHRDHIGGFGDAAVQQILKPLNPRVLIRPWTDIPGPQGSVPALGLDPGSRGFIELLDGLHGQAQQLQPFAFDNAQAARRARELTELGFDNTEALAFLEGWADDDRGRYVKAGDTLELEEAMPDVKIEVLGPPTIEQVPEFTSYAKGSEQYWLQLALDGDLAPLVGAADPGTVSHALEVLAEPGGAGAAGWLLRRLESRRVLQGLDIVEAFDDVLNNTSVILLLTVGNRSFLLPGDAQVENWAFILDQARGTSQQNKDARLARRLADVDVYKVGHHGSRNATPRRLTALWQGRTPTERPVVSLLTTQTGAFEKSFGGKVPEDALVSRLARLGVVHNTDELDDDVWWLDIEATTSRRGAVTVATGPAVR